MQKIVAGKSVLINQKKNDAGMSQDIGTTNKKIWMGLTKVVYLDDIQEVKLTEIGN